MTGYCHDNYMHLYNKTRHLYIYMLSIAGQMARVWTDCADIFFQNLKKKFKIFKCTT